jgi:hypothetical protein
MTKVEIALVASAESKMAPGNPVSARLNVLGPSLLTMARSFASAMNFD